MKNKKILWIAFAAVVLVQWYVPASMIFEREHIIKYGKEWKFNTEPVDPNDVFRGKYIQLRFSDSDVKNTLDTIPEDTHELYIRLVEDTNGFAIPSEVFLENPGNGEDILRVNIPYWGGSINKLVDGVEEERVTFDYPFERFYMEEGKAGPAETAYNERRVDTLSQTWAVVSILNGNAVLSDVMIDGKSVTELSDE